MTAKQIKGLRGKLQVTQRQLAQLLGVHPTTVIRWENDHSFPTAYQATIMEALAQSKCTKKIPELIIAKGPVVALATLL